MSPLGRFQTHLYLPAYTYPIELKVKNFTVDYLWGLLTQLPNILSNGFVVDVFELGNFDVTAMFSATF